MKVLSIGILYVRKVKLYGSLIQKKTQVQEKISPLNITFILNEWKRSPRGFFFKCRVSNGRSSLNLGFRQLPLTLDNLSCKDGKQMLVPLENNNI